jgi:DNA recombination protein RmuC
VQAGRATTRSGSSYAVGSGQATGLYNSFVRHALRQSPPGYYTVADAGWPLTGGGDDAPGDLRRPGRPRWNHAPVDVTTLLLALLTAAAGLVAGLAVGRGGAARAAAQRDAVAAERDGLRAERAAAEDRARHAEADAAGLAAALDAERAGESRLREAFQALSADALARNNEAFVRLAEARLREATTQATTSASGDLAKRQQAIEGLVGPLRETLGKVEAQIREVERGRAGAYAGLVEQVTAMRQTSEQLRLETSQLVSALRAPQVRGRWGEMQLRRVVEAAGMLQHVDFSEQETSSTADGVLRPDMVVRLAGGKHVVVDSKVAFGAFLEASEARDEPTRQARLKAHARHLRAHVDSLGAKAYWERFDPTPEFVVCFVPADVFLDAALQQEPTLLEHAFERNVVIATPSTLVAMLRTVGYAWRQEALARNAREVHDLAREFYTRLATMGSHVDAVGTALNSAVSRYNRAVSSLESRVLVSARKLKELRVTDAEMPAPRQVEAAARAVQAEVLVSGDTIVPLSGKAGGRHATASGQGDLLGGREASGG